MNDKIAETSSTTPASSNASEIVKTIIAFLLCLGCIAGLIAMYALGLEKDHETATFFLGFGAVIAGLHAMN